MSKEILKCLAVEYFKAGKYKEYYVVLKAISIVGREQLSYQTND